MIALNAKWRCGSECRPKMWIWMSIENVALNDERSETWLRTPKRMIGNGFECRYWEVMALNTETENVTLNVKLRSDDGSDRRNRKCDEDGSERRYWEVIMMALNTETENAMRMALNADTKKWWRWLWTTKLKMRWGWLWMPILRSDNNGSERRN